MTSENIGETNPSMTTTGANQPSHERKWKPLGSVQRRVVGVLVEKAKTTPDQYPLSLNSLITGCNQKSNRDPQMNLNDDQIEQAIQELRELGVVIEVQGGGRVPRYRHLMYEWLGVDKTELAVMAELLLRGAQTNGELRGRAARMEPIPDLNALKPVLQSLVTKGLILELTPEGRGQVISHALYRDRELVELRTRFSSAGSSDHQRDTEAPDESSTQSGVVRGVTTDMFAELRLEVAELRAEVARLRSAVQDVIPKQEARE